MQAIQPVTRFYRLLLSINANLLNGNYFLGQVLVEAEAKNGISLDGLQSPFEGKSMMDLDLAQ